MRCVVVFHIVYHSNSLSIIAYRMSDIIIKNFVNNAVGLFNSFHEHFPTLKISSELVTVLVASHK